MDKLGFNRATYELVDRLTRNIGRLADELERYNDAREESKENE